MGLTKYHIGELVELVEEINSEGRYGPDDVRGMTITKEIIPTKAEVANTDLSKFLVVHPGDFVFNPRTHGKKIGFGFNNTGDCFIISWNNIAFRVKPEAKDSVLPTYLFLHFNREEWDREACFRSWGSSTEVFSWDALCEMELTLPDIDVQRKYVDVYMSLQNNLAAYQSKVEDLKLVCDGYIEELRRNGTCERIGDYIEERREKNANLQVKTVLGISKEGFIDPKQDVGDLSNYWVFKKNDFVYSPPRINVGSIGLYKGEENAVCSPIYVVFFVKNTLRLMPEYLDMWLHRSEFFRSTDFYAIGSVRNNFSIDLMKEVQIPVPPMAVQRSIVSIYLAYLERKEIAARLKEQLNSLCPVLIKGSLQTNS